MTEEQRYDPVSYTHLFLNLHNYSQIKYTNNIAVFDVNKDIDIRPWEPSRLIVTGKEPHQQPLGNEIGAAFVLPAFDIDVYKRQVIYLSKSVFHSAKCSINTSSVTPILFLISSNWGNMSAVSYTHLSAAG